ncbi:MAG: hypothetical protein Q8R24_10180 [Legionellaceae bacterium]|nr:hypothetical protein [Legionellaceae bacterium]
MDKKNVLIGLVTAMAVGAAVASAPSTVDHEKQAHAEVISELLKDTTPIMYHPECTVREI